MDSLWILNAETPENKEGETPMTLKLLLSCAGLCIATMWTCAPVHADLVGLWRFDEAANPQPDSSAFGNDAEVIEATWVNDDERGGAMNFEGQGNGVPEQWLEVPDSDSLSIEETGLTIAAWANFAQFDTWNSIVAKTGANAQNKPSPYDVYTLQQGDGRVQLYVGEGDGGLQASQALDPPEAEVWTHITITMDEDGEVVHYLDGEENGDAFIDRETVFLIDEDMPLFIGSRLDGTTNMDGMLDDVAIFNHALTSDEVLAIMSGDFNAYLDNVSGDYNGDGMVDVADIDLQSVAMADAAPDLGVFDENNDGLVNRADRMIWVKDYAKTWVGDANLEGEFNSSDLVQMFSSAKYDRPKDASWADGDFDGNMRFDSGDLVAAFSDGGYEKGPLASPAVVPEPTTAWLMLGAWGGLVFRRR